MTTPNLDLALVSKTDGTGSSLPTSPDSLSSRTVRTQLAAIPALTPPVNPSPTQTQDEKPKRQFTQVPPALVNGTDEDDDDEYFDAETSTEESEQAQDVDALDDVEEAKFQGEDLTQESKHAKDIVRTLTRFLKDSWDATYGKGSWESTLKKEFDSAKVEHSWRDENIEDLAWIAVSKFVAKEAELNHEYFCPQFPWESTTQKGIENTEQLERWQEIKKYLALEEVQGVKDSEEGTPSQLQKGLSYLQNGFSSLAEAVTTNKVAQLLLIGGALCALSSIPLASAVPILGNATSALVPYVVPGSTALCVPGGVSTALGGCGAAATGTFAAIASGTFTAIGSVASAVGGLVPYVAQTLSPCVPGSAALGGCIYGAANAATTGTIAAITSTASALVPYVGPVCAVTSPIVVSILGSGVPNATNITNTSLPTNASLPMCNLSEAPAITGAATNGSWLSMLGYLPPLVYSMSQAQAALTAASDGNYGRAGAHLAAAALPLAASYYGPWAGTAMVAGLSAASLLWPAAPIDTASVLPAGSQFYERRNVICKKGIFNIKVPGPVGLSPEEQEDLIKAFISEVLDQNPVKTVVGDKIEFQFPESKTWTAQVTPRDGYSAGRTLFGEKTYNESPSHRNSIKKLETLRKVMVGGAKAFAVMSALRSITMDKIPNNAPTVSPVAFSNAPPALCSSMQACLAIPEFWSAMKASNHHEVNRIATAYEEKLVPGEGSDPLNLAALEAALNPDNRPLDVREYESALLDLMADNDDDLSKILVPQLKIQYPSRASTVDSNWIKARQAPIFPKLKISPNDTEESLQTLVDAQQKQGSEETQFHTIPNFLQISVDEASGTNRAAKVNEQLELDLKWDYIQAGTRGDTAPKPKYSLQNMILHADQGDVTYQRTVENVNGEPQIFYWKFDPVSGIEAPICIDFEEFEQAANSSAQKDLFFLKQEAGAVRAEEILAERYDSDSKPDFAETKNVSFEYDMTLPPYNMIALAVEEKNSNNLKTFVNQALQIAFSAGSTEITLPVPVGEAADGMNWPIGIMWYAAQEFMRTLPLPAGSEFKVTLAIDKSKKQGERRAHLVQQIDMAETIYLQHKPTADALARFTNFTNDWKDYSKPKPAPRRHFLSY